MAILTLTSDNFEKEVMKSDRPVVIDFWAPWCGPCRLIAPVIEQLDLTYNGQIKVCRLDVDEEQDIAGGFRIHSIPTVLYIKDGEVVSSATGYRPLSSLISELGLDNPPSRKSYF